MRLQRAFLNSDIELFRRILDRRAYKIVIRSSLAPIFSLNDITKKNWLKKRTMEYFAEHGGYENAHKANWTVFKAANAKK